MFKNIRQWLISGLMVGGLAFSAVASDEQRIQQKLNEIIPGSPPAQIEKTPIEGLYQVILGPNVIYITGDAQYLFNGNMVKIDTRENLTEAALNNARKQALDAMDPANMVIFPAKGESRHTITVFTDIDCPFCKKFHDEVPELNENGITVRYLAFPRSGPDTPTYHKMVSIWCADNPAEAMDKAKNGSDPQTKTCPNPVVEHMIEAQNFGVSGTPSMILENGQMVPGYVPAKELIQALN